MSKWINAFRLRTLPLAFSCIIMGSGLAMADGQLNMIVFVFYTLTHAYVCYLEDIYIYILCSSHMHFM